MHVRRLARERSKGGWQIEEVDAERVLPVPPPAFPFPLEGVIMGRGGLPVAEQAGIAHRHRRACHRPG